MTAPSVASSADAPRTLGFDPIAALDAIAVALPMRRPAGFASGTIDTAYNVIVRARSESGEVGYAEAQPRPYTYGETQDSILGAIRDELAPRVIGADPLAHERWRGATSDLGAHRCARAAVEVAIADLAGRQLSVPLHRLLGGAASRVPVCSMVSFATAAEMAAEVTELHAEHGISTFKVKVGRDPLVDIAAVQAIRQAVPKATLYVDANRGWTIAQARWAAPRLRELGVQAIEEPISLDDPAGRLALATEWDFPIGGDESCLGLDDVAKEIAGAVGQVSIKVARTGFAESREIAAVCRAAGTRAVVASQYEGALGSWASVALAAGIDDLRRRPVEAANFLDLARDVAPGPEIVDGHIGTPTLPGLGVDVDPDALEHYRIDR